ncbi:uncharacterized protein LOC143445580 isoform X1 [Clavelina lepadiformis]|uniref:uncharacterized protein LOC143445580 isoform X1 n=1 Tax=Clavelina lepadiformis TaxID=159417 RepID=UPI0040410F59
MKESFVLGFLVLITFCEILVHAACPDKCTCSPGLYDCRVQKHTKIMKIIEDDIRSIDLSGNLIENVTTIPEAAGLQYLNLANNKINALSYDAFDNLDELATLILSNNSLERITDDIFEWNPLKLEKLMLDGNKLQFVQHFLFYDLESLTDLDLSRNHITFIHPHAFLQLKKLVTLRLDGNKLHTFDNKWYKGLKANMFQQIHLQDNPWACDCAMQKQLTWLNDKKSSWFRKILSSSGSELICHEPTTLQNRSVLEVSKDEMSECNKPDITGISEETSLFAGQNVELDCVVSKTSLPHASIQWIAPNSDHYSMQKADKFEGIEVDQDGTMILRNFTKDDVGNYTCVATNFVGSVQAQTLLTLKEGKRPDHSKKTIDAEENNNVENEKYTKHNELCPSNCSCIMQRVDCTGEDVQLTDVPMKKLPTDASTISLASNKITTIPKFRPFIHLTELRMDDNQITEITPHAFNDLGNLTTLTMRDNRIMKLPGKLFKNLKKLSILVLDHNELTTISDSTFTGLKSLKWLYIRNNKLTIIGEKAFSPLAEIRYIHMENNDLPNLDVAAVKALTEPTGSSVKIQKVFVSQNKFYCDCRMAKLHDYLKTNEAEWKMLFGDGISCSYPPDLDGRFLQELKTEEIKCNETSTWTFYTHGGNANGAPCHFPFEYRGKTYRTCITDDHSSPWCATTADYPNDQMWGVCETGSYTKVDVKVENDPPSSGAMSGLWFGGLILGVLICAIGFFFWRRRGYKLGFKSMKYNNVPGDDDYDEHRSLTTGTSGSEAFV